MCCSPRGGKESDTTEQLNNNKTVRAAPLPPDAPDQLPLSGGSLGKKRSLQGLSGRHEFMFNGVFVVSPSGSAPSGRQDSWTADPGTVRMENTNFPRRAVGVMVTPDPGLPGWGPGSP